MKKRRQHYVWKKYLEPWCVEGKIWCHRYGTPPFHTNPINVAVKRDFYKLTQLTKNDILFIKKLAIDPIKNEALRELNAGWISTFDNVFKINHNLRSTDWIPKEFINELDHIMHNLDENFQNEIENIAESYLDSLNRGDSSFYWNDEHAVGFIYFLTNQYFRTKNIRDSVRRLDGIAPEEVSIERVWPIMRHIFTTCVGFNLYAKRSEYNLVILNNESDLDFITSDQPVQNVHAAGRLGELIDEVELYYPISPKRAIIISNDEKYTGKREEPISPVSVSYFNSVVVKSAYEQVFSRTAECLELKMFSSK
jgi:hypothetical protein